MRATFSALIGLQNVVGFESPPSRDKSSQSAHQRARQFVRGRGTGRFRKSISAFGYKAPECMEAGRLLIGITHLPKNGVQ